VEFILFSVDSIDYLIDFECFSTLSNNNIEFYPTDLIDQHVPKTNYQYFNKLSAEEVRYFAHRVVPLRMVAVLSSPYKLLKQTKTAGFRSFFANYFVTALQSVARGTLPEFSFERKGHIE